MNALLFILKMVGIVITGLSTAAGIFGKKSFEETVIQPTIYTFPPTPAKAERRLTRHGRLMLTGVVAGVLIAIIAQGIDQYLSSLRNLDAQKATEIQLSTSAKIMRQQTDMLATIHQQLQTGSNSLHELQRLATRFQRFRAILDFDVPISDVGMDGELGAVRQAALNLQQAEFRGHNHVNGDSAYRTALGGGEFDGLGLVRIIATEDDISAQLSQSRTSYRRFLARNSKAFAFQELLDTLTTPPTVEVRIYAQKGLWGPHSLSCAPTYIFMAPVGAPDFIAEKPDLINEEAGIPSALDRNRALGPMLYYKPLLQTLQIELPLDFPREKWSSTPLISCPEDLSGARMVVVLKSIPPSVTNTIRLSKFSIEFDNAKLMITNINVWRSDGVTGFCHTLPNRTETNQWIY